MLLIQMFNKAGSTGHVFLVKGGKPQDRGLAYSGFVGPMTTIAVVPTVPQVLSFEVTARTEDNQELTVAGSLTVGFVPAVAVRNFDFTVGAKDGAYKNPWSRDLQEMVVEQVQNPIRKAVRELTVEDAISAHGQIEAAIKQALSDSGNRLASKGVVLESYSVSNLDPADEDLLESIGAEEREEMLSEADSAKHERQLKAAASARVLKQYEVDTNLEVEKKRASLIEQQGKNTLALADTDAQAAAKRLEPFKGVDGNVILAASLMKMAEGRVGTVNIGTDLLTALGQSK